MESFGKICITGSSGMLGHILVNKLTGKADILEVDLPGSDITNREAMLKILHDFSPDIIIHCAAYTKVEQAEFEPELCYSVNSLGTRWLSQYAAEEAAKIVYFSSDYVFCGLRTREPVNEFALPHPLGVYALSKFAGEEEIRCSGAEHLILRTSWSYGPSGKNFVDTIIGLAGKMPYLKVVNDQIGAPTLTHILADTTIDLIAHDLRGLFHVSGNGSCSWFDFAKAILDRAGIRKSVYPISTAEFGAVAPRPEYSVLDHLCLRQTIGDNIPHWKDSLDDYFKHYR